MSRDALRQAVEVLNRERHRGRSDWRVANLRHPGILTVAPVYCAAPQAEPKMVVADRDFYLQEFEAIAVAEKYEREKPQAEPARSKAEEVAHKIRLATIGRQYGIFQ